MALENNSKNYIRISKVEIDYKSMLASVHFEIFASENIRNIEKEIIEKKSNLIKRFNELSRKGGSVYKSREAVVEEVRSRDTIQELIRNSKNLEEVNSAIMKIVDTEQENAHVSGRTYKESEELLSISNELDKIASYNIMTNTTVVVVSIDDLTTKGLSDIRGTLYDYISKDSRYDNIWNT